MKSVKIWKETFKDYFKIVEGKGFEGLNNNSFIDLDDFIYRVFESECVYYKDFESLDYFVKYFENLN